jgi:hypothetical protein
MERITVKNGDMVAHTREDAHKILDRLLNLAEDFELTADVNIEIDLSVLISVNTPKKEKA